MEEDKPKLISKYLTYIKNNKYNMYFIIAIAILIFMIVAIISITFNHSSKNSSLTSISTKTPSSTETTISSTPPSTTESITTPNPTQATVIESQIQPQITQTVTVPYTVSAITEYNKNWGVMSLNNPNSNIGGVIIKNINGTWKVVAGPGSFFPIQQLQSLGAPQSMINNFYPSISPSQ